MTLPRAATFLAACLLVMTAQANDQDRAVILDLHAPRPQIRAGLLRYTPLGSTLQDVLHFVSKQLQRNGGAAVPLLPSPATGPSAAQAKHRGVKTIRVDLGQYLDHPEVIFLSAPMIMEKQVSAQWAFDAHDRLINLFVDKSSAVY